MQTSIDWTSSINWLIIITLLILLFGQLWLISRNQTLTGSRKWLRIGLNVLLWLVLVGFFLKPEWPISQPSKQALLVADNVPSAFVRYLRDSLHIRESFTSRNFKPDYDSVTLVGQTFSTETLTQLSKASLSWIPYNQPDQLESIRWKGIVQQGEIQHVTGQIRSSKKQMLRVRFGNKTLDSTALNEGNNSFSLRFPTFGLGRSTVELTLDKTPIDTLRFFAQKVQPLSVQFLLNNPDFESKTLADWLGKHGHSVQLSATLSKDISSNLSINKPGKKGEKAATNLLITEPNNANNVAVRKAIADGKSVLFINLTNPETDTRLINQATGSQWNVLKTANEATVHITNDLAALPYRFADKLNQFMVTNYPIAVQQTNGRVGVSLLSETYPLALSGDSVTYNQIWMATLAHLMPAPKNTVQVDAPVYTDINQTIAVNNPGSRFSTLQIGRDTVALRPSPINEQQLEGTSAFGGQSGWTSVADSLALYVYDSAEPLRNKQLVNQFARAHTAFQTLAETNARHQTAQLPDWAWLILLLVCFTALWVEPKF